MYGNDFTFYKEVNELVQEEPAGALDPERAGQRAAIGIAHGQPFSLDERAWTMLGQVAQVGAAMARALVYAPRDPQATRFGTWKNVFVGSNAEFERTDRGCWMPAASFTTSRLGRPPP